MGIYFSKGGDEMKGDFKYFLSEDDDEDFDLKAFEDQHVEDDGDDFDDDW